VHSDLRPHKCSNCIAAFTRKDTLTRSVTI
jgi:hypothetical protein